MGVPLKERTKQQTASLIVPVYNSAPTLAVLWSRIVAAMEAASQPFHVVFVDDASTDDSVAELRRLAQLDRRVRAVFHARNAGQAAAVRTGIAHATDLTVVTLDDDLSHRPEDVARLLQCLLQAADERALVVGVAIGRPHVRWRFTASVAANGLCNLFLKNPLPLRATTFCAFQRTLGETLIRPGSRRDAVWLVPLIQAAACTIALPVVIEASALKRSRYRMTALWKLLRCRARSFVPRRLLMFAGLTAIVAALVTAIVLQGGAVGQSRAFLLLDGLMIALAAATAIFTWLTITDRRSNALEEDPPVAS